MTGPTPLIEEDELRELLADAELDVDAETFQRILAAVQPMRAMIRSGGLGRRRAILRGAMLPTGPDAPRGQVSSVRPPGIRPEPREPQPRPTLRHLVARLGAIYLAVAAAFFAVMSMMGPSRILTVAFGAGAVALLVLAVTGRGLGGLGGGVRQREGAGTFIGMALLILTGAGPLLLLSVGSLLHPGVWIAGDFVSRATQAIGLVTLYVVGSHLRAVRRAD